MKRTQTWTSWAGFKQRCWKLNQVLNGCLSSCRPLFCSNLPTRFLMYYPHLGHIRGVVSTNTRYSGCGADQNRMSQYRKKVLHSLPPKINVSPTHKAWIQKCMLKIDTVALYTHWRNLKNLTCNVVSLYPPPAPGRQQQIFVASRCQEKGVRFHNYSIVKICQAHAHIGLQLECPLGTIKKFLIHLYAITSRAFHQPCGHWNGPELDRGWYKRPLSSQIFGAKNINGVNTENR